MEHRTVPVGCSPATIHYAAGRVLCMRAVFGFRSRLSGRDISALEITISRCHLSIFSQLSQPPLVFRFGQIAFMMVLTLFRIWLERNNLLGIYFGGIRRLRQDTSTRSKAMGLNT